MSSRSSSPRSLTGADWRGLRLRCQHDAAALEVIRNDGRAGRKRWMKEGRDLHVYFDNDALGHAPRNARRLIDRLAARGRRAGSDG